MTNLKNDLNDYIKTTQNILNIAGISEDFFIKPKIDTRWDITSDGEMSFLIYYEKNNKKSMSAIVRKEGEPVISKSDGYTFVLAIDCVKILFVFDDKNKDPRF